MAESLKLRGLIVQSVESGEQDKRLTILSEENGKLYAVAKGAKKSGARMASSTEIFFWCELLMEKSHRSWILRESIPIYTFSGLRKDLTRLAWASWMAETAECFVQEGMASGRLLKILLRGLHLLEQDAFQPMTIASTFVLRTMVEEGLSPDPVSAEKTYGYTGLFTTAGRYTLDHIRTAEPEKLYQYTLTEELMQSLYRFARDYLSAYLQHELNSLRFLQSVIL